MTSEKNSITKLALEAINDEQFSINKFSEPREVVRFLTKDNHFKRLSEILEEVMHKAPIKKKLCSQKDYVDTLFDLLVQQDAECGDTKKRNKITVERWFSGKSKSISYRADVIEICFALQLDKDLSTELLNKCGYNGFNAARNAEDATYLYCILNHLPFSEAKRILSEYQRQTLSFESENTRPSQNTDKHSGQTTFFLDNQFLLESNWSNSDEFLRTYLIPNKNKFIGYASTALKEYYILKNNLYLIVLFDAIEDEADLVFERIEDEKESKNNKSVIQTEIPVSLSIRSALQNQKSNAINNFADFVLSNHICNTENILSAFQDNIGDSPNINTLKVAENFIYSVLHIAEQNVNESIRKVQKTIPKVKNLYLEGLDNHTRKKILGLVNSVKCIVDQKADETVDDTDETITSLQSIIELLKNTKEVLSKAQISIKENPECQTQIQISEISDPFLQKANQYFFYNPNKPKAIIKMVQAEINNSPYVKAQLQRAISNNTILRLIDYDNSIILDHINRALLKIHQIIKDYPFLGPQIQEAFFLTSALYLAVQNLSNDMRETKEVLTEIHKITNKNPDIDTQKNIANFLNDIKKIEGVLKYAIHSIEGKNSRIRPYGNSALKETVMKRFPTDKSFNDFEKNPEIISQEKGIGIRKAIILMYYIAYAYDYSSYISDYTYTSDRFGEMGFTEFMNGLNTVLRRCKLPPLYPANQFDWLILYSIRAIENSKYSIYVDPLKPFNDVISFSFGDSIEEDD